MATIPEANLSLAAARKPLAPARRMAALLACTGVLLALGACGQKGPLVLPPGKVAAPPAAAPQAPAASQPAPY